MSGWIVLDKDSGVFSRSAGARVARLFNIKKFGHIGTLDPMATGVLPGRHENDSVCDRIKFGRKRISVFIKIWH